MEKIFSSVITGDVTVWSYLLCTLFAFLSGIIIALASTYKTKVSKSFFISLLVLPVIVETVIMMVNGNVGTGIAVAGAFSLVRFRSVPGKAKDIASIFLAMTAGLACAAGYIAVAVFLSVTVELAIIIASSVKFGSEREYDLRITVPENLNYKGVFDEVFSNFTKSHKLTRVKTVNMGSLYKLYYRVELKNDELYREFIDELRIRNGNLEISLTEGADNGENL